MLRFQQQEPFASTFSDIQPHKMTPQQLIILLENRIAHFTLQRTAAEQRGDIDLYQKLDADIVASQTTLSQLRSLIS